MAALIKGITVTLISNVPTGEADAFNAPIYQTVETSVDNVLVSPTSSQEIIDAMNLYGKKATYTLAIPKGDAHVWENNQVKFFGQTWRVIGKPIQGLEDMIPLDWNKKVMVEAYE